MKHLATQTILVILAALFLQASPLQAVDWRSSEEGIFSGEIANTGDGDYYPLKVGNSWTYKLGDNKFELKVVKYEQFGGTMCARVEMQNDGKALSFEHLATTNEGIYRIGFEGNQATPPVRILGRYHPQAGEQWKVQGMVGKEKLAGTFKCAREPGLKVGDKVYDTFVVSSDDLDANGMKVKFKSYYARNVGMVKQVITIGAQEVVIELEKFEPGK